MTQVATPLLALDFGNLFIGSARRGKVPVYMNIAPPPAEILDDAACTPADAALFDENLDDESERGPRSGKIKRKRQAQALRVCNGYLGKPKCPVRAQCALWALENGQLGVYGGQIITTRTVSSYRRAVTSGNDPQPEETVA